MQGRSFLGSKKIIYMNSRHSLAIYNTVKYRRNFKHFFNDGMMFITPTVVPILDLAFYAHKYNYSIS